MTSFIKQCTALSLANMRSLTRRPWISLSMVFSVALVALVLLGFLAMANGFRTALTATGSDKVAIVLGTGATTELGSRIEPGALGPLEELAGIARDERGRPIASREVALPIDATERGTGYLSTLTLRGVGDNALAVRPGFAITQGRMLTPRTNEIVVGAQAAAAYEGLGIGEVIRLGSGGDWTVVGHYSAGGSVFESEIIGDIETIRGQFARPGLVQSVRLLLTDSAALAPLAEAALADPRIALPVQSEAAYFSAMASGTSDLILYLGWPLAITMALGAAIGALTTMYSSVADRSVEIATVRALGFSRKAAFVSTWIEALFLTLVGCGVGVAIAYLTINGMSASTTGADQTQIGFELTLSAQAVVQTLILSLVIGAIGGGFPALNATRLPLRLAMTGRS